MSSSTPNWQLLPQLAMAAANHNRAFIPTLESTSTTNNQTVAQNTPKKLTMAAKNRKCSTSSANFTVNERICILSAIIVARNRFGVFHDDPHKGFSDSFCNSVREILIGLDFGDKVRSTSATAKSPSDKTLRSIWVNFVETGQISRDSSGAGRKKKFQIRDQVDLLVKAGDLTFREIQSKASTNLSLVHKILKKEGNTLIYRAPVGLELSRQNVRQRLKFALKMHSVILTEGFNYENVLWTGAATLTTKDSQSHGFWRLSGKLEEWLQKWKAKRKTATRVDVFFVLHHKYGTFGPYFIDETILATDRHTNRRVLDETRYRVLLETRVVPDIKAKLTSEEFKTCWWQQDVAPTNDTLNYLRNIFGDRIFSDWPARSPELNPVNYFFWNTLKLVVGLSGPKNELEVKHAATKALERIDVEFIRRAISDFAIRIEALVEVKGAHFDLNAFRISKNRPLIECDVCDSLHACLCDKCQKVCLSQQLDSMNINEMISKSEEQNSGGLRLTELNIGELYNDLSLEEERIATTGAIMQEFVMMDGYHQLAQ